MALPLTYFSNLEKPRQIAPGGEAAGSTGLPCAEAGEPVPRYRGQALDLNPKPPRDPSEKPPGRECGGKRKACTGFSKSSARTLSRLLASLDFRQCIFLTLTQRPGFSPQEAKEALIQHFFKALGYLHPEASGIWRMERQKNGSPHFHILLFGLSLEEFWNFQPGEAWAKSLGISYSPQIDFQLIRKSQGAYLYLVGHSSKKNQTWPGQKVGRYWGVFNRKGLPLAPDVPADFLPGELDFLRSYWERCEDRRVKWLKGRYPEKDFEPRDWEFSGPLKLFPASIAHILKIYRWLKKTS